MRTVVFNQGFNRVEHHQIICLERAKLNRLLDEERRITETLAAAIKRQIEAAPNLTADAQAVWNDIQNHSLVKAARERINLLTDAYPQFFNQVETARQRLKKRIIESLEIAKSIALTAAVFH
jgi:plasmid maintenance system antidote protein VapI